MGPRIPLLPLLLLGFVTCAKPGAVPTPTADERTPPPPVMEPAGAEVPASSLGAAANATLIDTSGNEFALATAWQSKYAVIDFYRGHW